MKSIYYVPRKPDSIPLINKETDTVQLVIEGELVEMPYSLFQKIYKESDSSTIYKVDVTSVDSIKESAKSMILDMKKMGFEKDDIKNVLSKVMDTNNMQAAKSIAMGIIDDVYKEIE